MPELPEVETMRRGVLHFVGRRVAEVGRVRCRRRPIAISPGLATLRRRMIDRRVSAIDRIGKRVCLRMEGGDALVIEPRMTGLVLSTSPPTKEHLRFRIAFHSEEAGAGKPAEELIFWDRRGLGVIRLLSPAEQEQVLGPPRLGPDALAVSAAGLQAIYGELRREIKPALLDQQRLAGVGNLYASEILHVAGVSPLRRCHELDAAEWKRLHRAMRSVLRTAIRYEGSTLADGTYLTAVSEPGRYQNQHRVYAKAEATCPSCFGAKIRRIVQAQRSTYYCPGCQQ